MAFFGLSKKPHKGVIANWYRVERTDSKNNKMTFIQGNFMNHPKLRSHHVRSTSEVVNQYGNEVETLNSRYTLGTPRAEKTEEDNF